MAHFNGFSIARRRTKGIRDITGHYIPCIRDNFSVAQRPASINGDVHCTTTNIHHADTQLTFIFRQHGITGCQPGKNQLVNFQTTTFNSFDNVLRHVVVAGNKVDFCLHTYAGKTYRIFNAFLVVNGVFLRNNVQNTMFIANAYGFCRMYHVFHIFLRHFLFGNGHHTNFILTANMFTGKCQIHRGNLAICHQFSLVNGALYALHH